MNHRTLEDIIKEELEHRHEGGDFGIEACKRAINSDCEWKKISLYQALEGYVKRANEDFFFNRAMVLACWELINER